MARAASLPNDAHTLLYLSFDGTLKGASGELPTGASQVYGTAGVVGGAMYFPPGNYLTYDSTDNIRSEEGTLEYWIQPYWPGGDGENHCVLAWGAANGAAFTKDAADNLRSLFNRWGIVAPEVGVSWWIGDWPPFVWRHVAFTWRSTFPFKQTVCRLYLDGRLISESTAPYVIYPPTDQPWLLRVGGEFGDGNLRAVLDELRISDIERTAEEIRDSYLRGATMDVGIDIKPGSDANPVNLYSKGNLPIAILGSAEFDASRVDAPTVRFGRTGVEAIPERWGMEDVNRDGRMDLLLHFPTQDTGLYCGDRLARLSGATVEGYRFRGSDSIDLVRCPPYVMNVTAMQDVRRVTDVAIRVSLVSNLVVAGCAPPSSAQHIQLKTFDPEGRLAWTVNEHDVPMTRVLREASEASLAYDDMARYQPVAARVQVRHPTERNTEIVRAEGKVLLRPDLKLDPVWVPPTVFTFQSVVLSAFVRELNGDLGATASVVLLQGDKVWDSVKWIRVGAGTNAVVVFSIRFREPGRYDFTVQVNRVDPGDYDLSNNERKFFIDVLEQPLRTVSYSASYNQSSSVYSNRYEYAWGGGSTLQISKYSSVSEYLSMPGVVLNFPLWRVGATYVADGTVRESYEQLDVPATWWEYQPTYSRRGTWQVLGDNVFFRAETFEEYGFGGWSSAGLDKYAADIVYFSEQHSQDWGSGSWSGQTKYGTFLDAQNSVGIQLILQGSFGKLGGWAWISPLSIMPYNNEWDWSTPEGWFERGFSRGVDTWGSSWGETQP